MIRFLAFVAMLGIAACSHTVTNASPNGVPCKPDPKLGYSHCTELRGDLDGDGRSDRVVVIGSGPNATNHAVAIYRSNGQQQRLSLGDAFLPSVLGLYDVNHDGALDAFVITLQGANTDQIEIIGYSAGRFRRFRGTNGRPFLIAAGGAAYHATGFVCGGTKSHPRLTSVGTDAYTAKQGWEWSRETYALHDITFRRIGRSSGFIAGSTTSGPPRRYAPGADCGLLSKYLD